jgi:voltage-gated potassium channel
MARAPSVENPAGRRVARHRLTSVRADHSAAPTVLRLLASRLTTVAIVSLAVVVTSSTGYVLIADYSWFNAVYMTVITFGTIGYGEVEPLDTAGRAWTIGVIIAGFCTLVYTASVLTTLFVAGDLKRALLDRRGIRMRMRLCDHVIVIGFGRVGVATTSALRAEGRECVVVDVAPYLAEDIEDTGAVALIADAREESTLREAGVERATALVAAAHDDATNLVVVLTARSLRPDLRIVARVNDAAWLDRIARAGADAVVSPYGNLGVSLAAAAVNSTVVGVQDLPTLGIRTEEIAVRSGSLAIGRTLRDVAVDQPEVLLIGLRSTDGISPWHEVDGTLREGDVVLAVGSADALSVLAHHLAPQV